MFLKRLFSQKMSSEDKKLCYEFIRRKDVTKLKELLSSEDFYLLPKRYIFRFIHLCANSHDPHFRNVIVDFLFTDKNYIQFAKKHVKNFSSSSED